MGLGQALIMGVIYWLGTNKLWYGMQHLARQPLVMAVPIGLVMGDLPTAMTIAASLQLIYLGAIAPGGTLPSDEALASAIAIPIAIQAGLSPQIAVSIAMPLGLLGVLIDNVKRTYHSYFVNRADKAAENLDRKTMERNEFLYPFLLSIPLRVVPVTLGLYFGTDAIQSFLNSLPEWVIHGLTVAGGILPALGFAVTIIVIGKRSMLPYFFIGFAIAAYTGINMIGLAVFAISIAIIQSQFAKDDSDESEDDLDNISSGTIDNMEGDF